MPRRIVGQLCEFRVPDAAVEAERLEVVGVEVSVVATPAHGGGFDVSHERSPEASASMLVRDPEVADEEPLPMGVARRSAGKLALSVSEDGEPSVLFGRCSCQVPRDQIGHQPPELGFGWLLDCLDRVGHIDIVSRQ